jgi:hypothetical protein
MEKQNYKNHAKLVPMYHYFTLFGLAAVLIGSFVNLYHSTPETHYSAALICGLSLLAIFIALYARVFALRAQDRVIVLEENLRAMKLTGNPLDSKLSVRQIIGLRFASDAEYADLAKRAVEENLTEKQIKQAIKDWKGDYYRV